MMIEKLRVAPGEHPRLAERDPATRLGFAGKEDGLARLEEVVGRLGALQARLAAEALHSVLLVLQGVDASGKDGTINHVFTGVNPQGCRVTSFKQPSTTELAHDYLWRVHAACPGRGEIAIFNRSHYEDVIAVRIHDLAAKHVWQRRYRHIREFERLLADEGTTVVKVFLHVSNEEQRRRLQERVDDPEKSWKLRPQDLEDRARWPELIAAYEDAITETSSEWAPWYVVPADHNWVRNLAVAELLVRALEQIDPHFPAADPALSGLRVT